MQIMLPGPAPPVAVSMCDIATIIQALGEATNLHVGMASMSFCTQQVCPRKLHDDVVNLPLHGSSS